MKEEILTDILDAIFWKKFTPNQERDLKIILSDDEPNKGTTICDYLDIPRRGNRSAIEDVLKKHSIS